MSYKVEIVKSFHNLFIVDEKQEINVNYLNKNLHELLIKRKDLNEEDTVTKRIFREEQFIFFNSHGSFFTKEMMEFIIAFFEEQKIDFSIRESSNEEKNNLKQFFPESHILGDQMFGGGPAESTSRAENSQFSDSDTIDLGVDKLCYSLNSIPGIETFASCNGHGGTRSFYVTYTAETIESAEIVIYYITNIVDKVFVQLNIDIQQAVVDVKTQYMPFGTPTGIYFLFEINYKPSQTEKIYQFGDLAADIIKTQVAKENFGIKNEFGYLNFKPLF